MTSMPSPSDKYHFARPIRRLSDQAAEKLSNGDADGFQSDIGALMAKDGAAAFALVQNLLSNQRVCAKLRHSEVGTRLQTSLVICASKCWIDGQMIAVSVGPAKSHVCTNPVQIAAIFDLVSPLGSLRRDGWSFFDATFEGLTPFDIALDQKNPSERNFIPGALSALSGAPQDTKGLAEFYVTSRIQNNNVAANEINNHVVRCAKGSHLDPAEWCYEVRTLIYRNLLSAPGSIQGDRIIFDHVDRIENSFASSDKSLRAIGRAETDFLDLLEQCIEASFHPSHPRQIGYVRDLSETFEELNNFQGTPGILRLVSGKTTSGQSLLDLVSERDIPHAASFILRHRDPTSDEVANAFQKRALFTCAALLENGYGSEIVSGKTVVEAFPWEKSARQPTKLREYIFDHAERWRAPQKAQYVTELSVLVRKAGWEFIWIYGEALAELKAATHITASRRPFEALLSTWLLRLPSNGLQHLVNAVDTHAFEKGSGRPHDAALMASLNHSDRVPLTEDNAGKVNVALTASRVFEETSATTNFHTASLWRDIGRVAYQFPEFKFDARGVGSNKCFLEKIGFQRFPGFQKKSAGDYEATPKFLMRSEDCPFSLERPVSNFNASVLMNQSTLIRLSRYDIIFADLESRRVLVFANHSPFLPVHYYVEPGYFGRDRKITPESILALNPGQIETKYRGILNPKLYYSSETVAQMRSLMSEADTFFEAYRAYKFDTHRDTAFGLDSSGNDVIVGAHNSPGFTTWLETLAAHSRNSNSPIGLKLVSRTLPTMGNFPFFHPGKERYVQQLILDERTLRAFRLFEDGRVTQTELDETGIWKFIEMAVQKQAIPIPRPIDEHDLQ